MNKTPRQINAERKKEGLPPLNFALFRKVIKKLETAPQAYKQSGVIEKDDSAPCGTAACIGGWAYLLNGHTRVPKDKGSALNVAAKDLGLSHKGESWTRGQAGIVFAGNPDEEWPAPFNTRWWKVTTRRAQARIAIDYLTHIIKTGKVTE